LPGLFGLDVHPAIAQPRTRLQAFLLRNVSARYAVNKWFTAGLGGAAAVAIGLSLTAAAQSLWASAISNAVTAVAGTAQGSGLAGNLVASFLTPDLLKLFAVEHRIPLVAHVSATVGGTSASGDVTLNLPLTGLLLVPALALAIGGYVAASSDYQRMARFSIARGALIGPFYALFLTALAVFSSSSVSGEAVGVGGSLSLGPSPVQAFGYGLLWGTLFGAAGGWIQLVGRSSLALALPVLQSVRRGRLAGAVAGAVVAYSCSILLFLALGIAAVGYAATAGAASVTSPSGPLALPKDVATPTSAILLVLVLAVTIAPTLAAYTLALATGAPIAWSLASSVGAQGNQSSSLGFIGAQHTVPIQPWFLIAVVPAICYLAGGRVAARVARANRVDAGFAVGVLMGLPLSVLMAGSAVLVSGGVNVSVLGIGLNEGAGPSVGGSFLAALIAGSVVGGFGGASAVALPQLGSLPRLLLLPLRPLGFALFPLLDALTAQPRGQPRSAARTWLYDGVLAAVGLGPLAAGLDIANVTAARELPFQTLVTVDAWAGALVIGVPLLYFIGALVNAFSAPAAPPVPAAPAYVPSVGTQPAAGVAPVVPFVAAWSVASWPAPPPAQPLSADPPAIPPRQDAAGDAPTGKSDQQWGADGVAPTSLPSEEPWEDTPGSAEPEQYGDDSPLP
jgi:hypothetical protein